MASHRSSLPSNELKQHRLALTVRSGHFREALDILRGDPQLRTDPANLALLAELQMRTGNLSSARDGAQRLLQHEQTEFSAQIRCHLVLGTICRDSGRVKEARTHYEKAIDLARCDGDLEQLCLAQIMLVSLHAAGSDVETAALLPALRRNVHASGDPFLAIGFHIFLAEAESRKGQFVIAKQQLAAARSLLADTPNVFLEGNAAIAAMCLSLLCSEYQDALQHGALALRCAEQSGNYRTALAARLNLGQALLSQGRLAEAEHHLREALQTCPKGGNNEIGVLDALAQVFLARGDLHLCEDFLVRIDDVLAEHDLPVAYNRYWGIRTKLTLLGRMKRWSEAEELVAKLGRAIPIPSDSSLHAYLILARAEVFLATGKLKEANCILCQMSNRADSLSLENQATLERLLALHAVRTCPLNAPIHFERAFRILHFTGNLISCLDVLDEYRSFLLTSSLTKALNETSVDDYGRCQYGNILNRIAALHRFSDHQPLLGLEAFWLLVEAGYAEVVTLCKAGSVSKPLLSVLPQSRLSGRINDTALIHISLDQGNIWKLCVRAKPHKQLSASCETIAKLVQVCVTVGIARREQHERDGLRPFAGEIGDTAEVFLSDSIRNIAKTSKQVASTTIPILITGQTGTGKEVLARLLHQQSSRSTKPFVAFNCTTVPHELLDSQLFGHRRGAFTGAYENFSGLVQSADGGTLFLDEIGDLGRDSQPKLLRFLESGEIYPLGDVRPAKANVRIIAATNADLERLVADGKFREDLFYRLNVVRYHVPPLRDRREEIPALVDHFLRKFSEEFQKDCLKIADETLDYLLLFSWPGNVRQLANEIRRAVALAEDNTLLPDQLSPEIFTLRTCKTTPIRAASSGVLVSLDQPLASATEQLERAMLEHALQTTQGKIDSAARLLGLSRKGLFLKRNRLGVKSSHSHTSSR